MEQRAVAVTPGSTAVISGDNLLIIANARGFETDELILHVRDRQQSGDDAWQTSRLTRSDQGDFRYTLFRINADLQYRVEAGYTESELFDIDVVRPARLVNANLTVVQPEWTQREPISIAGLDDVIAPEESRIELIIETDTCLLYTSPSPRDATLSRMPSSA